VKTIQRIADARSKTPVIQAYNAALFRRYRCIFISYREEKRGFFARLTRRGAKKNAATEDGDPARRTSRQVDPATFPEVKSRKSILPPLHDTAGGDEAVDGGRRRRRRRSGDLDEADGQHDTLSRHIQMTHPDDNKTTHFDEADGLHS